MLLYLHISKHCKTMSQHNKNFIACRLKDETTLQLFYREASAQGISVDKMLNKILMAYFADPGKYVLPAEVPKVEPKKDHSADKLIDKVRKNAVQALVDISRKDRIKIKVTMEFEPIEREVIEFKLDPSDPDYLEKVRKAESWSPDIS